MILRPTVFDRDVLPFDIARFAQPLPECSNIACKQAGCGAAEEADYRQLFRLLGGCMAKAQWDGEDRGRSAQKCSATHAPCRFLQVRPIARF